MKNLLFISLSIFVLFGCKNESTKKEKSEVVQTDTIEFKEKDLTLQSAEEKLKAYHIDEKVFKALTEAYMKLKNVRSPYDMGRYTYYPLTNFHEIITPVEYINKSNNILPTSTHISTHFIYYDVSDGIILDYVKKDTNLHNKISTAIQFLEKKAGSNNLSRIQFGQEYQVFNLGNVCPEHCPIPNF